MKTTKQTIEILGKQYSPKLNDLFLELRGRISKSINFKDIRGHPNPTYHNICATYRISSNSVTFFINQGLATEIDIAHEFMHVIMELVEGYPTNYSTSDDYPAQHMGSVIKSAVVHKSLLEKLEQRGFNARERYQRKASEFINALASRNIHTGIPEPYRTHKIALDYLEAELCFKKTRLKEIKNLLEANFHEAYSLGNGLINIVERTGFSTPEQIKNAMTNIVNFLGYQNRIIFPS